MRRWSVLLLLLGCLDGAIIDRIAIIVGTQPILDSEISQDIRITSFLNHEKPDFSDGARRTAASRMIDQELIRQQIRSGAYPVATTPEADQFLAQVRQRYQTEAQFKQALAQYGIDEPTLKDRLLWQLTVLRFIDARFRPSVVVSDQEIETYYNSHRAEFRNASLKSVSRQISDIVSGERVNKLLDEWLADSRKQTRLQYLETSLQ